MRIIVDAHIPFVVEAVQRNWPQTEVLALEPEEIGSSSVRDADVLIIRTRTKVNEALLAGSSVRLVCTATIGYDHIDRSYCETHGIRWISCPGCGRTLYNLQETIARIKAATSHLVGLKIGIMGCIVNGPGEMADADYGYVGAGRGRISLYRGKECVEKNIPEAEAVDHLLQLIDSDKR